MSGSVAKYGRESRALSVSLVLVLPLLLAYEVGILLFKSPVENLAGLLVKRLIALGWRLNGKSAWSLPVWRSLRGKRISNCAKLRLKEN